MATAINVLPQGFNQATAAMQAVVGGALRGRRPGGTRRRRKASAKRSRASARTRVTRRARRSKRPMRLVKGSAAAKRYMAKIRRKRRR
jgi:hypothetical protein